ncbi:MAG: hypothetical protein OXU73_02005 [Candidatus Campbellbacteria bacterium]|nr:hypothetical protein [Candidatus Campbellbacteria bacterium]
MVYKYRYSLVGGLVAFLLGMPLTLSSFENAITFFLGGSILLLLIFFAQNLMPSGREQRNLWITLVIFLPAMFYAFQIGALSSQYTSVFGMVEIFVFVAIPLIVALAVGIFLFKNPKNFATKLLIALAILGFGIFTLSESNADSLKDFCLENNGEWIENSYECSFDNQLDEIEAYLLKSQIIGDVGEDQRFLMIERMENGDFVSGLYDFGGDGIGTISFLTDKAILLGESNLLVLPASVSLDRGEEMAYLILFKKRDKSFTYPLAKQRDSIVLPNGVSVDGLSFEETDRGHIVSVRFIGESGIFENTEIEVERNKFVR